MNAAAERRLSGYFDRIGALLGRNGRRESFALYAQECWATVSERASSRSQPVHAPILPALMPSISDFCTSRLTRRGVITTSAGSPRVTHSKR